jgi:uncharacterized membrane protein YcaP (DUF421 family)
VPSIDWHTLFVPGGNVLELVVRGSVMYLLILCAFRFFRRESGSLGTADLLLLVLIADAAQNAMAGEYRSITEGVVLVGTILGWNILLDWLAFRSKRAHRLIHGEPLPLVLGGRIQWRNLRREFLTRDDLLEQLRQHQVEDVAQVKRCYLEPDGHLSVQKYDPRGQEDDAGDRKPRAV